MTVAHLTDEWREWGFRRATSGYADSKERWTERARTGRTNAELAADLRHELGIQGGSCGPGQPWVNQKGLGLKIWVSASGRGDYYKTKPTWEGSATIAKAREVYGIADPTNPDDYQLTLF